MVRLLFYSFVRVLRDGVHIWVLAPIIPALIVLPEFAQHIAEINIGMFASRDAAVELAENTTRWAFGYAKLAGLLLAVVATIRYWGALRTGGKWWDLSAIRWRNVIIAITLSAATTISGAVVANIIGEEKAIWIDLALTLATLPLIVLLVQGLAGDRSSTLSGVFRNGWFAAIRIFVFAGITFLPLQLLHEKNHEWAFGTSEATVWGLMAFDSLVVGLIATLAGTAFHHGSIPLREGTVTFSDIPKTDSETA